MIIRNIKKAFRVEIPADIPGCYKVTVFVSHEMFWTGWPKAQKYWQFFISSKIAFSTDIFNSALYYSYPLFAMAWKIYKQIEYCEKESFNIILTHRRLYDHVTPNPEEIGYLTFTSWMLKIIYVYQNILGHFLDLCWYR